MAQYRDAHRDPALEAEHRANAVGHLIMPDGSVVSSGDWSFLTVCAPLVYAAHIAARTVAP